jgi:hypothetical protein
MQSHCTQLSLKGGLLMGELADALHLNGFEGQLVTNIANVPVSRALTALINYSTGTVTGNALQGYETRGFDARRRWIAKASHRKGWLSAHKAKKVPDCQKNAFQNHQYVCSMCFSLTMCFEWGNPWWLLIGK